MTEPPSTRAVVGRALVTSSVVMLLLAGLYGTGVFPVDPAARGLVTMLLIAVAIVDLLIAFWLLRRR
jgi:hypothetical protein